MTLLSEMDKKHGHQNAAKIDLQALKVGEQPNRGRQLPAKAVVVEKQFFQVQQRLEAQWQ